MFKIILILATVAVILVQARPGYLHSAQLPYEVTYTPTVVGHSLHSFPTAVSHQSQTIVHEKRPYLRPIIEHTPILNSYTPAVGYSPYSSYSDLYDNSWTPSYKPIYGGWHPW